MVKIAAKIWRMRLKKIDKWRMIFSREIEWLLE